jgi:phage baseplate assembly protein V
MDDANRASVIMADSNKKMQILQVVIHAGDVRDGVEHFEPYGFTSCPQDAPTDGRGAEAIVLDIGGCSDHPVAIVVGDRRFRIAGLEKGEVCIHDDQGQRIFLKRDGIVVEGKQVTVNSDTVKLGNGADAALVRWPELKTFLQGLVLTVINAVPVDPLLPVIAGPPASVPDMGTLKVTAK